MLSNNLVAGRSGNPGGGGNVELDFARSLDFLSLFFKRERLSPNLFDDEDDDEPC